jgi:hypothetical protein
MMRKKRTPEERDAERARVAAEVEAMRAYVVREREKLDTRRRGDAEPPRGRLRRLFSA